jgi:ketosteroid isomerase-like protein
MSQENVEIVRAGLDAYNREDWDDLFGYLAPDFVLDMSRSVGPQRGIYELSQMRSYLEDFAATFESVRIEAEGLIDVDELVVMPNTAHVRGRDGIEATAHRSLTPPAFPQGGRDPSASRFTPTATWNGRLSSSRRP